MTPFLEAKLIGTLFGEPWTAKDLWLGLTDAGAEVTGAGYQRQHIKGKLTRSIPPANTQKIEFPLIMGPWGTVDGAAVYDSPQGGNCLWPCELPPQEATPGRRVVVMPGQLRLSLRRES